MDGMLRGEGCDGWDGKVRGLIGRVFRSVASQCILVRAGRGPLMRVSLHLGTRAWSDPSCHEGPASQHSIPSHSTQGTGSVERSRCVVSARETMFPCLRTLSYTKQARKRYASRMHDLPHADLRKRAEKSTERVLPFLAMAPGSACPRNPAACSPRSYSSVPCFPSRPASPINKPLPFL